MSGVRYRSTTTFEPGHLYLTMDEVAVCIIAVQTEKKSGKKTLKVINIEWTNPTSVDVGTVYSITTDQILYEIGF